jgi:two-component system sensor histidine kinase ChiS
MTKQHLALVVEDDPALAQIFSKALEDAGCQVTVALDGSTALEHISTTVPEIVLLDLQLPGIDGETLLDEIRDDERLHETRVVLATAHHERVPDLREKADWVLLKPIGYRQLRDLAARLTSTL